MGFYKEVKGCYLGLYWSGGAGARTRDEFQARGAGRAGPGCPPSVRACVTLKKGPKGLQNHQETITFIDKSEKVGIFQVLK